MSERGVRSEREDRVSDELYRPHVLSLTFSLSSESKETVMLLAGRELGKGCSCRELFVVDAFSSRDEIFICPVSSAATTLVLTFTAGKRGGVPANLSDKGIGYKLGSRCGWTLSLQWMVWLRSLALGWYVGVVRFGISWRFVELTACLYHMKEKVEDGGIFELETARTMAL